MLALWWAEEWSFFMDVIVVDVVVEEILQ